MRRLDAWTLVVSILFVVVMAIQYPMETTFPIGGDATRYILDAQEVVETSRQSPLRGLQALATNSAYPGTTLTILAASALPIPWPILWTVLMSLGHLTTALALFFVGKKLTNNVLVGVASGAAWSIVGITLTRHIEDGTIAQLLSLPALVFFIGYIAEKKYGIAAALGIVTFLLHPLSGLFAAFIGVLYVIVNPDVFLRSLRMRLTASIVLVMAVAAGLYFYTENSHFFAEGFSSDQGISLSDLIHGAAGPLFIVAPLGAMWFIYRYGQYGHALVISAAAAYLFMFQNQLMGESVFLYRTTSYAALFIALFSGIAVGELFRTIPRPRGIIAAAVMVMFAATGTQVWAKNIPIYKFYEAPINYARLHPDELAAIEWMRDNLPAESFVVSTRINRHSEWIPILSGYTWEGLETSSPLFTSRADSVADYAAQKGYTHAVFFHHRESMADTFQGYDNRFPVVYQNKGVTIVSLSPL